MIRILDMGREHRDIHDVKLIGRGPLLQARPDLANPGMIGGDLAEMIESLDQVPAMGAALATQIFGLLAVGCQPLIDGHQLVRTGDSGAEIEAGPGGA